MKRLILAIHSLCFLLLVHAFAQPNWATDQLAIRDITKQLITETQKWEQDAGGLYYYLNNWKWDDEVEIFYYWLPFYYLTGDQSAYETVKRAGLRYIERAENAGKFYHGYYENAYYDTEHTMEGLIILANLAYANPTDTEVIQALQDLAEHTGNWVSTCESWTNYETGFMRSLRPGTREVKTGNNTAIDWPFNLQFAKLALAAYHTTGKQRYLDWVQQYLEAWTGLMKQNETRNGFFVPPCSVDPYTGVAGPYSGLWWEAQYEPGWSWKENGFSSYRDFRVYIDCFVFTQDRTYLNALSRFLMTLFDNGDGYTPAHYFDGTTWTVRDNKWIAFMGAEISLLNNHENSDLENAMSRWLKAMRYPYNSLRLWDYMTGGELQHITYINEWSLNTTQQKLDQLKALTALPPDPDDFPKYTSSSGCSMVPFGAITAPRGEMPHLQVMYFRNDRSLGLYKDVAALFKSRTETTRHFSLCNTGSSDRTIWVQADYLAKTITSVLVNNQEKTVLDGNQAQIIIPANSTIDVQLNLDISDTIPPAVPKNVALH